MTDTYFDFKAWQAQQAAERAMRRVAIQTAISQGVAVRQNGTIWTTAGVITTRFGIRADAIFIDSCQSDPAYIAEHLENREYGFGWPVEILRATS